MRRRFLLRQRPRPGATGSSEAGMTILELVLAMTVMLGALLTIAHTGTAGLGVVAKSRQRQEAAALSSQTLEKLRALPFDTLVAGLDNTDLANAVNTSHADYDPAITTPAAGVYQFQNETIPRGNRAATVDPLYPHLKRDVDIGEPGGTLYDVASYVTNYDDVAGNGVYRLTVTVTWDDTLAADGRTQVMSQSIATSPAGCLSTTTRPFSGPCRPFFYGVAGLVGGQISIGPSGPDGPLAGVSVDTGRIELPSYQASIAVEQTQTANSFATTSGGTMTFNDGSASTTTGYTTARTQATNDITKAGVGAYNTASVPAIGADLSINGPTASSSFLQAYLDSGDTGSSISTVGATGPQGCLSDSGVALATLAPCANATARQANTKRARLRMEYDDPLESLSLRRHASVTGATGYAGTYRDTLDSSTTCPILVGKTDRCVRSYAERGIPTAQIARFPAEISGPSGFTGSDFLVTLSGFHARVVATAGQEDPAALPPKLVPAPTATLRAGATITYWNGAGFTTDAALPYAAAGTLIPAAPIDVTDNSHGFPIRVRMTPDLRVGGTEVSASVCADPVQHCAEARSYSPILGTVTFQVDYAGVLKVAWTMNVDFGTLVATATYKEAPSG